MQSLDLPDRRANAVRVREGFTILGVAERHFENGNRFTLALFKVSSLSALPPLAPILQTLDEVAFVPIADLRTARRAAALISKVQPIGD
jgi:hypothetical protein